MRLEERVYDFRRGLLPNQPKRSHPGTAYLVRILWEEVKRLREKEVTAEKIFDIAAPGSRDDAAIPLTRRQLQAALNTIARRK